jgi:RNA polymerase sigma-70 factor (ECF subfamily)
MIEKAIENLPEQSRMIFRMSRYEYLSNDEIATKLNISVNTVKTHISRSLKKLREQLEDYLH